MNTVIILDAFFLVSKESTFTHAKTFIFSMWSLLEDTLSKQTEWCISRETAPDGLGSWISTTAVGYKMESLAPGFGLALL